MGKHALFFRCFCLVTYLLYPVFEKWPYYNNMACLILTDLGANPPVKPTKQSTSPVLLHLTHLNRFPPTKDWKSTAFLNWNWLRTDKYFPHVVTFINSILFIRDKRVNCTVWLISTEKTLCWWDRFLYFSGEIFFLLL